MGNLIIVYLVAFVYAIATCHPYYQGKNNLDVVVYGITATRHHVSGEIPGFDKGEKFTPTYNPGALIKFFISNRSETDTILPTVRFNGKTGKELLEAGIVSYCNTPEIRESNTALSSKIPPSCIDLYVLNVTDSNFYSKGIRLTIDDRLSSKSFGQDLKIEEHLLAAERILFTSSDMSKHPDGFRVYLRNKGSEMVTVTGINFFESSGDTRKHWWIEQPEEGDAEWFGRRNVVPAGDFNGAYVKTGKLPFGELLVEINYKKGRDRYKEIFNIKPLIIDFSFGMGWAEKDLAGSNAFCRTMSLLHLNTVNGNASGFFSQADKATKYEVKKFARLQDVEVQNRPENLNRIHAAEHFGEPQFSRRPAQEIYDYYTTYRNSGYPSTLTLSHEPGFNRYAGVVDFPHFDAYRVTAPHADRWGEYKKYGEKNVRWGAPLETIGDYMRTLHRISVPNPVAAWTQGMSNDWSHRLRSGGGNPNNLEMRLQAYEAIANGAISLYWFNMSGKNIINSRQSLAEIQRINRELKIADEYISLSAPYSWEQKFNDADMNVLAGSNYAVLMAMDLNYSVAPENQFVSSGRRKIEMEFSIPDYLYDCKTVAKITNDGVLKMKVSTTDGKINITDNVETTAIYILYNEQESDVYDSLLKRFNKLIESEKALGFNPITNDNDFNTLVKEIQELAKIK